MESTSSPTVLPGIRVLDLSQDMPGAYCGRLLATAGADVIKVEPPRGDATRDWGPFPDDVPDRETSGAYLHLNASKRGVTLDLSSASGRDLLLRLAASADIVVESFAPGTLAGWGLGYDVLKQQNPRLILTSITPFGQTGPYRDYRGTELGIHAISGELSLAGQPEMPLRKGINMAQYFGGLYGFLGTMGALFQRQATGAGEHIDVSLTESFTSIIGGPLREHANSGRIPVRREEWTWPTGRRPAKDGHVMVYPGMTGGWWPDFTELMGDRQTGSQPREPEERQPWEERFSSWMMERSKFEIYEEAQKHRLTFGYVATAPDLLKSPQLQHRGYFQEVEHPRAGTVTSFSPPFLINGKRLPVGRAPLLGEHNETVYCGELGLSHADLTRLRALDVI